MKTGKKLLTGSLLALCAALLVLCIVLAAGWSKAAKIDTALPEVRNNGNIVAVGGNDQRVVWMNPPTDDDQAHASRLRD